MRSTFVTASFAAGMWSWGWVAGATVSASADTNQTSTTTNYLIPFSPTNISLSITEDVANSTTSGPWHKTLTNDTGSGLGSGDDVDLVENLTNVGADAWTGWHELIVSRTDINSPNDAVGFLFRQGTLTLSANYGGGFVNLSAGVDYTLTTIPYSGPFVNNPGPGNEEGWEQIDIVFAPGRVVETGDMLRISKSIFEVFGDSDPWRPDDAAEVAQYPSVPEPANAALAVGALALLIGRRRRHD